MVSAWGRLILAVEKAFCTQKLLSLSADGARSNDVAETDKERERLKNCTSSFYTLPVFKLRKFEIWTEMYVPVLPGSIKAYVSNVLPPLMMETGII